MSYGKKTRNPGWKNGGHWVVCDVCSLVYRNKDMMKRWDGTVVCKYDFEARHPQDLIRAVKDDQTPVGYVRPEGEDTYGSICTPEGRLAIAGRAVAGCSVAGRDATSEVPAGTF